MAIMMAIMTAFMMAITATISTRVSFHQHWVVLRSAAWMGQLPT